MINWEVIRKLAEVADTLNTSGYNALYTMTDTRAEIRIEGTKICDDRGLDKGLTDDILIQHEDHKGFVSLKNCGDFTVISSTIDTIDLLDKYVNSIK